MNGEQGWGTGFRIGYSILPPSRCHLSRIRERGTGLRKPCQAVLVSQWIFTTKLTKFTKTEDYQSISSQAPTKPFGLFVSFVVRKTGNGIPRTANDVAAAGREALR
jgi:hypothetical protein